MGDSVFPQHIFIAHGRGSDHDVHGLGHEHHDGHDDQRFPAEVGVRGGHDCDDRGCAHAPRQPTPRE